MKPLDIQLVIFDMDGLMFDTERIAFIGWKQAGEKYGYEIPEEVFLKTLGANFAKTNSIYVNHFGEEFPIKEIRAERIRIGEEIIDTKGVPVKEGLYELLRFLKGNNIKTAVATSTVREKTLKLLKLAEIDSYFDYIVCGDEIINSKPNPEIFLKAADKLNCSYDKCIVLEDSEAGVTAAHQAGMLPVMIPDMKQPSEEIEKLVLKKLKSLAEVKNIF